MESEAVSGDSVAGPLPSADRPGARPLALTRDQRRLLALLGLPTLGLALAITIVSTYLPVLIEDFTSSGTVIGLLIGGEGAIALFVPLLVGAWSDRIDTRFGKRLPFLAAGGTAAVVALILMPIAPSLALISVALAAFYLAYFTYYPPYRALFPDLVPTALYGRAQSSQAIWRAIGLGLALVSGGVLLAIWRPLPFVLAAVVLAAVTGLVFWRVNEPPQPVGCCQPESIRETLAASWRIWRADPRIRSFIWANALWELTLAALKTFIVLFIVIGLGRSVGFASLVIGIGAAGSLVAAIFSGTLGDRYGLARVMHVALWVYGLGLLVPVFTQAPIVLVIVPVIAFGGGVILTLPYGLLAKFMPDDAHGAATGLYGFSRGLGVILGPLIAGVAIDASRPILSSTDGYAALFGVMGIAALASIPFLRRVGLDA